MSLMRLVCFTFMLLLSSWGWTQEPSVLAHPQAQLWALLENGLDQNSIQLESELKEILLKSEIREVRSLGGGLSESWLVRFPRNIHAVLKPADRLSPRSPFHEAAAYQLDRLLKLHMVPLTVVRDIGGTVYSVQLYYPSSARFQAKPSLAEVDPLRLKDIQLFDAIIANQDRHLKDAHNALEGLDGRLIAYDHGRTFAADYRPYRRLDGGSIELKEQLLKINVAHLQTLSSLLNSAELAALNSRIQLLQVESGRLSWTKSTSSSLRILNAAYDVPTELRGKGFIDLKIFEALFPSETSKDPIRTLKSALLVDPTQSDVAQSLFERWSDFSVQQKEYILKSISAVATKDQVIPDQAKRLIYQNSDDVLVLEKSLSPEVKATFAYAMFIHEISMLASVNISLLAQENLNSKHGRSVISRALYALPSEFKNEFYQDLFVKSFKDHLQSGTLRWSDILSIPEDKRMILLDLISTSNVQAEFKEVLTAQLDTVSLENKDKAIDFVLKIKRAVKAPLCRAIFN